MNTVKEIHRINERELESGGSASWHDQYKDSAYIYVGGLPFQLTEGDVITIFSQYGEVVDVSLPRDPNTQKPRGFAFLMYADQRSTVLAVDNLGGSKVLDRTLKVDHVLNYKQLERDNESGKMVEREEQRLAAHPDKFRAVAGAGGAGAGGDEEGDESDSSYGSIDIDDPMRDYLIEQRKAAKKAGGGKDKKKASKRDREDGGETKEERKERREKKRKAKEMKALEAGGGKSSSKGKEREDYRHRQESKDSGRRDRDDRDRSRHDSRDDRDHRRPHDSGRDRERSDRDRPRESDRRRESDRDARGDRDSRRNDGRDERSSRGGAGGGGSMSAFADLEKWAKGA